MFIICLKVSGHPICPRIDVELHQAAMRMIRMDTKKLNISSDVLEGRMETDFLYQAIGTLGGFRFDFRGDTEFGEIRASFLCEVPDGDVPEADAYEVFYDPASPYAQDQSMLN